MRCSNVPDPHKLIIATPLLGHPDSASVSYGYHTAIRRLERAGSIVLPNGELTFTDDIMRGRSRCVRYALSRPACEWLLFWDSDTNANDAIIPSMLARAEADGHMWMGASYPRKRLPPAVPFRPLPEHMRAGRLEIDKDCIEVAALGLGLTIIHRTCLERMTAHYREELWFSDTHDPGHVVETVDLFNAMFTPETTRGGERFREKLGEDYAACYRWRAIGGKVQMYIGEGTPVAHVGPHTFTATNADLCRLM